MTSSDGERSRYFPAIEKKHGGPISIWFDRLTELGDAKYPQQIAYLRENHGFSQTHANALVMHHRGSTTSKRFTSPESYFKGVDPTGAATARKVLDAFTKADRTLEVVMAWNKPMLRRGDTYVLGLSVATKHITIGLSSTVLADFAERLEGFHVGKKTFQVPNDWKIDAKLLKDLLRAQLAELD